MNTQPTTPATITTAARRALRARAHALSPVVSISQKGLTETVLKEIDRCLTTHELIKVRVYHAERDQREALLAEVCAALAAAPVQHIGNLLVIWREKPENDETVAVPKPAPRRRSGPRLTKKAAAAKTEKTSSAIAAPTQRRTTTSRNRAKP